MDLASEAVDGKAQVYVVSSVSWNTPRQVGPTPQIERRIKRRSPKRLFLVEFVFFVSLENACLVNSLFDQSDAKSNLIKNIFSNYKKNRHR